MWSRFLTPYPLTIISEVQSWFYLHCVYLGRSIIYVWEMGMSILIYLFRRKSSKLGARVWKVTICHPHFNHYFFLNLSWTGHEAMPTSLVIWYKIVGRWQPVGWAIHHALERCHINSSASQIGLQVTWVAPHQEECLQQPKSICLSIAKIQNSGLSPLFSLSLSLSQPD